MTEKMALIIATCGAWKINKSGIGTWGALIGLTIQIFYLHAGFGFGIFALTVVVVFALGMLVIGPAESTMFELYGPRKKHDGRTVSHDFNQTCIDEVFGQLVAGLPVAYFFRDIGFSTGLYVLVFLLFRIFDIVKPWPIKKVEKLFFEDSPLAILLDDGVGGVYVWPFLFAFARMEGV